MRWGDCGLALPSPNLRHRAGKSGKSELAQLRPELQDVSIAGNQEGLQGSRSSLVRCVFETLDRTGGCGPELGFRLLLCGHTDFHHTAGPASLPKVVRGLGERGKPAVGQDAACLPLCAAGHCSFKRAFAPCAAPLLRAGGVPDLRIRSQRWRARQILSPDGVVNVCCVLLVLAFFPASGWLLVALVSETLPLNLFLFLLFCLVIFLCLFLLLFLFLRSFLLLLLLFLLLSYPVLMSFFLSLFLVCASCVLSCTSFFLVTF